jgi:hypothetical protein
MKNKEEILKNKAKLAEDSLRLAETTLSDLEACASEASVKDLLAIFTASIKAHRDLTSDIIIIEKEDAELAEKSKESAAEKELSLQYSSKVDELLKNLKK